MGGVARAGLAGVLLRYAARLRFPYLFGLTALVFVADLAFPDLLPFADEILLGLLTVLFGSWRKSRSKDEQGQPNPPGG